MPMLKKQARKVFRKQRDALTPIQMERWNDLILIHFQTIELPFLSSILSYYSIEENHEVNSFLLTDFLHFRNPSLQVAYPRMDAATNTMQAIIATADAAFDVNEFGITEPANGAVMAPDEIELVLIPLLAFDEQGQRVGYGKGYYDRFLKDCSTTCIKVGISFLEPVDVIEDADEFDVPLDFCITPQKAYVF
jgi:5-formyltetrahydrofolate cyclo-ligase